MASVKLMVPRKKPKYYKLTANVIVNGHPERRYSRFEFDPAALKTQKSRLAAANAAAVAFEKAEQQKIDEESRGYGKTFAVVAQECIDDSRSLLAPSLRLEGDFEYSKNKANTTRTKEIMLKRICEISDLGNVPIHSVRKADCEKVLKTLENLDARGTYRGYAVLLPDGKRFKKGSCSKIAAKASINLELVERAFRGEHIRPENAEKIAAALGCKTEQMFSVVLDHRPMKRKTIREYANFMRLVMEYANDKYGVVNDTQKLKVRGCSQGRVDCLHEDEVAALQEVLPTCTMLEQALIYSLLNTGVRRGELAALTWRDFDFRHGCITVSSSLMIVPQYGYQITTTKADNIRHVHPAPEYMDFMQKYHEEWIKHRKRMGASWQTVLEGKKGKYDDSLLALKGTDFVICNDHGFPLNPDSYAAIINRVGAKAGIAHLHPHKFRHTFVSILLSNPDIGVATVAAEAGHAQPSTTLAIYTQVYKNRQDSIRQQMSRELYRPKKHDDLSL